MADYYEFSAFPTVGAAWAEAVRVWESWVDQDNRTVTPSVGTQSGFRALILTSTFTGGSDTRTIVCTDIINTASFVPLLYVLSSPGFRRMPKVLERVKFSLQTDTRFQTGLVALRGLIFSTWCGIASPALTHIAGTEQFGGIGQVWSEYVLSQGLQRYRDVSILCTTVAGNLLFKRWDAVYGDGIGFGATQQHQAPGAAADNTALIAKLTELVTAVAAAKVALEDIAHTRLDVSLNHGQAIASVSTNTTTGL